MQQDHSQSEQSLEMSTLSEMIHHHHSELALNERCHDDILYKSSDQIKPSSSSFPLKFISHAGCCAEAGPWDGREIRGQ